MDIEIYRKFFGSIAKPQRSGKVFSNCESVPPIDGDTVTNRYPPQSGHEGLSEMLTPEADRATKAEGGEGQQRYIRQQGESLKNYLHRTRTDIFLFLREALKPTDLTPAQEMKIVEELREAYQVMWQGQRVPRNGKYLIKSECERVISALDGAIIKT